MISFEMKGDISVDLFKEFHRWETFDPMPLMLDLKRIIEEENDVWLSQGIDATGREMDPILPSTFKRGRGGGPKGNEGQDFGPPLVPRYDASRAISGFEVSIAREGETGYVLIAGWPGAPWLRYHQMGFTVHAQKGDREIEPRPVAGFRPSTNALIDRAIDLFLNNFVNGLET